ncbi:UDP-N-acetylmuramoyl-L-alanine--D-glutamate ligase [Promicromonospora sukumoe]|uniref:UDP-N-acetylmuramoylalanine--D-glutamate ligase n=1 Tax=Promicromonospora sukumoe TaxID=88382 RepID=A0A7W3PCV0_9MICO|nr:UDP-N-acetylmuramoyl-L-alanine--D-glutamate ligase [Promicromonospora sukumoe]MBA8807041.1 UDP-N-acetylmuramoylalanine--D-glutamate ligase [Promicromonospora sukumoe]
MTEAPGPEGDTYGPAEPRVPLAQARVVLAGLGVTGRSLQRVLEPRVASLVTVDDRAHDADHGALDADAAAALLADADLLVASPGFPPHHPVVAAALAAGVPVWSEVELAWRLRANRLGTDEPAAWLGITGSNGKTTTVEMLAAILRAAGLRTAAVGNVGRSLVEAALDPMLDVIAVELSSFQLHFTHTMSLQAGAVLNVSADHLDWHGSLAAYTRDKGRIYENVQVACVYNVADATTEDLVREADVVDGARAVGFAVGTPGPGDLGLVDDVLVDRAFHAADDDPDRRKSAAELGTLADLKQLGDHNGVVPTHIVADALAAAALARAHGVPASAVRDGLRSFGPGEHRIQRVAESAGVTYVNDSKATNAHSAAASLAGFAHGTVVWIAGGLAKGATFDDLVSSRADRMRAAVVIGAEPGPLADTLARHAPKVPVVVIDPGDTETVMRRAVEAARDLAQAGDTVLLAPAGASQDQFASYAHRGEEFVRVVRDLTTTR